MLNFAAAERAVLQYLNLTDWFSCRILDNAHLLDATEIFRKLNVHKKVWNSVWDGVAFGVVERNGTNLPAYRNHSSSSASTWSCSSFIFIR